MALAGAIVAACAPAAPPTNTAAPAKPTEAPKPGPELRNKGVVQPLTPFIQKDTKWATNDQKQFFPGNIANYTAQGQQWGYPVVGHPGNLQYYINTDMAAKVGAKLPDASTKWHWTFEQAMDVFSKGTQKG